MSKRYFQTYKSLENVTSQAYFQGKSIGGCISTKEKKKVIQEKLGHESQEKSEFDLEIYEK